LTALGIDGADSQRYLDIIEERARTARNGAAWQRRWVAEHGADMPSLTAAYETHQSSGRPVHEWPV
jgi:hypothetical protein